MIKKLFQWAIGHRRGPIVDEDEDLLRYPPFMRGLPAVPIDKLLDRQSDILGRVRQAVGAPDALYESVYLSLIRRYAAYVHLLPASEGHHHRGSGGLLRHGLEVALFATQLADQVMWAMGEPPARRRELEPRWCCAVFVAALCHDVGKPLSDLKVVDQSGEHQWPAVKEPLIDWCERVGTKRYFLRWSKNRHQRHESMTPLVLPRLIPEATFDYINEGGEELYQQLLFAISSRDFTAADQEHNRIYQIVRKADQESTGADISNPAMAGMPGALGVPLERYLMDAMRRMVREQRWKWNKPGARVWIMDGDVFLVWPAGADDIVKLLVKDNAPGIPRHPDTLADILLERGLAKHFDAGEGVVRTWPIQPDTIREKNPNVVLHALRLTREVGMFDELPGQVDGRIGEALLDEPEDKPQTASSHSDEGNAPSQSDEGNPPLQWDEENTPSQPDAKKSSDENSGQRTPAPQPGNAASQADAAQPDIVAEPAATTDAPASDAARKAAPSPKPGGGKQPPAGQDQRNSGPVPGERPAAPSAAENDKQAAEARAWLAREAHAGVIITALAEDFRDGLKQWGQHGVRLPGGTVGIRHPDGWSGVGVAAKDMLPLLSDAGWVDIDPFQPMKRIREVEGFTGVKGGSRQSVLVLVKEVSEQLLAIADSPAAKPRPGSGGSDAPVPPGPKRKKARGERKAGAASTAAKAPRHREDMIAVLHEILTLGKTGLPHRRDGDSIRIPFSDAARALSHHVDISHARLMQRLTDLRDEEDGDEIVIPARQGKKQ